MYDYKYMRQFGTAREIGGIKGQIHRLQEGQIDGGKCWIYRQHHDKLQEQNLVKLSKDNDVR